MVMTLQILQSRLFSVVTWYSLSFLVISITMFGLTLGALSIYKKDEAAQRDNLSQLLGESCFTFATSIIMALAVQLAVPIVSASFLSSIATLPFITAFTAAAYFHAGRVITLCLTRSPFPVGRVYAADLTGAALGCLGALFLMNTINVPSAIMVVAAMVIVAGLIFLSMQPAEQRPRRLIKLNGFFAAFIIVLALLNCVTPKPFIFTPWSKGHLLPQEYINYEKWNAISRVTITPTMRSLFLWGPSPLTPQGLQVDYQYLTIDGDAGTPLTAFNGKDWDSLKYLEYDVTNIAYALPHLSAGAVIGVGGGRDLLSARYFGLTRTVALDVNATQVRLLTQHPFYKNYTNLAVQPNTSIINSEARSWLTRSPETFDIIQMSLIDTWASTGAGAFALSENSLYTVEAFKIFLGRLNPGGVLTVSRWYTPDSFNELARLTAVASQATLDRGGHPSEHILIAQSATIGTLVLSRDPFTPAQLAALHARAKRMQFNILAAPDVVPDKPLLKNIVQAPDAKTLHDVTAGKVWNLTPSTDMKPFFFNQAYVAHPWSVIGELSRSVEASSQVGNFKATINLYLIILLSLGMSSLLLIPSLRRARGQHSTIYLLAGFSYFALIGIGFMFIEISLMQTMSMFLGHPTYGLGIVLFSLILSSGIGSYVSEYVHLDTLGRQIAWCILLCAYVTAIALNIETIMIRFIALDFLARAAICTSLIFPCGFMLGFGFPTGMRIVSRVSSVTGPLFWAVNGAAGVTASALALIISIGFGLDKTMIAGGVMYALLILPLLALALRMRLSVTLH